jgi:hypothetical protein
MGKRLRAALLACLAVFYLVYSVSAQVNTADILGTVSDAGGAVLPNAKVTVQNTATNEIRTATTSRRVNTYSTSCHPGSTRL